MEFKKVTNEVLNEIIAVWQNTHSGLYSNFFGLQDKYTYEYYNSEHTILIRRKEFDFFRIYLLSDSREDIKILLGDLQDEEYVFNVPTKKSIEEWDAVLIAAGFKYYETYSKMINTKISSMKIIQTEGTCFAKLEELDQIHNILKESFSVYTSHIQDRDELIEYINNKNIRVEHAKNGSVCGVVIFSVTGTTATATAWASNGEHGMDLYLDMFNYFIEKGAKRYIFWVRDSNVKVKKLYEKLGAVPLGVKDYTYIKKK